MSISHWPHLRLSDWYGYLEDEYNLRLELADKLLAKDVIDRAGGPNRWPPYVRHDLQEKFLPLYAEDSARVRTRLESKRRLERLVYRIWKGEERVMQSK